MPFDKSAKGLGSGVDYFRLSAIGLAVHTFDHFNGLRRSALASLACLLAIGTANGQELRFPPGEDARLRPLTACYAAGLKVHALMLRDQLSDRKQQEQGLMRKILGSGGYAAAAPKVARACQGELSDASLIPADLDDAVARVEAQFLELARNLDRQLLSRCLQAKGNPEWQFTYEYCKAARQFYASRGLFE